MNNKEIDNKTVMKFLEEEHALHYGGLDDEMPDDFDEWLGELDEIAWVSIMVRWGRKLSTLNNKKEDLSTNKV